ncbi:MAG TPA: glycosyltransferase [Steroidobacter sp.]|uniref:glycosyltransferase n=1 Tax=Steroidobacter sp. TaxID=1978227 RepID=UPI002ED840AC
MTTAAGAPAAVMHLIDTGGPGGAETVFAELLSRIGQGTLNAFPIVPREGWLSGQLRSRGFEPVILESRGSLNAGYFSALLKLARQRRVRLIHTHLLGSGVYGAMVGLAARVPVIAVMHGPTDLRAPGRFASIKRWLLRHGCSAIVAVSTSTRDALVSFGIDSGAITLIRNGVDTALFSPGRAEDLRQELGISPDELVIGAIGNIRTPKAYDVLLKAAKLVLDRVPRARFLVVGEGDEQVLQPLLQLRAQLGIEARFQFLGFRKSTSTLYHNFDVFVSSSRTEGLSLSFLEAMATGRAIVATRSGGAEEGIEPDVSGVLTPIEDPPALAAALERVLNDADLRQRLGEAARARVVQSFSLEATIGEYEALYRKVLARGR